MVGDDVSQDSGILGRLIDITTSIISFADIMEHFIKILNVLLLLGAADTNPLSKESDIDKPVTSSKQALYDLVIYTSQHDIVSLTVPLKCANFKDNVFYANKDVCDSGTDLYFVEADIDEKGKKEYKGVYCFANGTASKVLETGTDVTAIDKEAYISAKDGIYVFNALAKKIEKYGNISDSLIGIAKARDTDVLYVLTEDHNVYKVTNGGNTKEKLHDVRDAQQILLDFSNNLFFYGTDKVPYVVTEGGVKRITGTLENASDVFLIKLQFSVRDAAMFVADEKFYAIFLNGTSLPFDVYLPVKPMAFAPELGIIQYYSYNKKIYERNMLLIALLNLSNDIVNKMEGKLDFIKYSPARLRNDSRA